VLESNSLAAGGFFLRPPFIFSALEIALSFIKIPFRYSSQAAATCYYQSNHSKVEAIPLSALPKNTTKAKLPAYLHTNPLNAEHQAGKL